MQQNDEAQGLDSHKKLIIPSHSSTTNFEHGNLIKHNARELSKKPFSPYDPTDGNKP